MLNVQVLKGSRGKEHAFVPLLHVSSRKSNQRAPLASRVDKEIESRTIYISRHETRLSKQFTVKINVNLEMWTLTNSSSVK